MAHEHKRAGRPGSTAPRTTTYAVVLGRVIASARIAGGLSQAELAMRINAEQSAVSRIERGEIALAVHILARVARAVGMPAAEIMARVEHGVRVLEARGVEVRLDAPRRSSGPSQGGQSALALLGAAAVGAMIALAATADD